jgi:large subunit ribosomal protein L15
MIHGQRGFNVPGESTEKVINVGEIEEQLDALLKTNKAKKEGSVFKLDVRELGVTKVLGKGLVRNPIHLYTKSITSKAQDKIEAAGGKVFQDSTTE